MNVRIQTNDGDFVDMYTTYKTIEEFILKELQYVWFHPKPDTKGIGKEIIIKIDNICSVKEL